MHARRFTPGFGLLARAKRWLVRITTLFFLDMSRMLFRRTASVFQLHLDLEEANITTCRVWCEFTL